MFKRLKTKLDIENQLYLIQIFGIVVTAALCLVVMLTVTLSHSNQQQEEEPLDEGVTLARAKNGNPFPCPPSVPDGTYRFYGPDGEFLLLGRCEAGTGRTIKSFFEV